MKNILHAVLAAVLLLSSLLSFVLYAQAPTEKKYTILLTESQLQATFNVIDASGASHTLVKQVEQIFIDQYNAQQPQKAGIDSLKNKKP